MFFKKPTAKPLGVPLDDLEAALVPTTLKAKRSGDALIIRNDSLTTRVDVEPPENADAEDAVISAIVTVKTQLPPQLAELMNTPGIVNMVNRMATLGAMTEENGHFFIGSRLTVYDDENAWDVQFGLILFSVIAAAETMLGAMRRTFANEPPRDLGHSYWTEEDFKFVHSQLSRMSVCTLGSLGLTAEFGLRSDELSAVAGHKNTALWQMKADQPHPEMGSGLFCLLNMPHKFDDGEKLSRVLAQLNRMEMMGHDLPPHFGAWCVGGRNNNPAYVAFLPNAMHSSQGIALNMSIWAMNRAQIADAMLRTM